MLITDYTTRYGQAKLPVRPVLLIDSVIYSIGIFSYNPGFDYLTIDTGNKTRAPSIRVTGGDYQGLIVKSYVGCSIEREFIHNGSRWKYQVARFKFDSNIDIRSHIRIIGANALSLVGENISIETSGKLQIESSAMRPPYGEPSFVGGFVAKIGGNGQYTNALNLILFINTQ